MMELADHIALVKDQLAFHERQASKYEHERQRCALHMTTAGRFRNLLADLMKLDNWQALHPNWMESPKAIAQRLALSWEEIEGLPKEVLAELSISDSDRVEFSIVSAIRAMGGIASLDRLIVHLFRETGEVHKRTQLNQRLYRMTQKDLLFSVPGRKGIYSIDPVSEEDLLTLA